MWSAADPDSDLISGAVWSSPTRQSKQQQQQQQKHTLGMKELLLCLGFISLLLSSSCTVISPVGINQMYRMFYFYALSRVIVSDALNLLYQLYCYCCHRFLFSASLLPSWMKPDEAARSWRSSDIHEKDPKQTQRSGEKNPRTTQRDAALIWLRISVNKQIVVSPFQRAFQTETCFMSECCWRPVGFMRESCA